MLFSHNNCRLLLCSWNGNCAALLHSCLLIPRGWNIAGRQRAASQVGRLACTHCGCSHQSYLSLSFCARSTLLIPHKASLFIFPSPTLNITFFSWLCVSIFRQRIEGRLLHACVCVQRLVLYTWLCVHNLLCSSIHPPPRSAPFRILNFSQQKCFSRNATNIMRSLRRGALAARCFSLLISGVLTPNLIQTYAL